METIKNILHPNKTHHTHPAQHADVNANAGMPGTTQAAPAPAHAPGIGDSTHHNHHRAGTVTGAGAGAGAGAQPGVIPGDVRVSAESGNNFPGTNPDPAHSALGVGGRGQGAAFPGRE
ncbi:hypothetical protein QBC33DRAFT_30754 [Phialemonium atrogriseum]|uniref:Uncharacterized protein n=1 Tax=Phialemonium atrogriseum TaxID=1093897 RepID=A0AAJ0C9W4_9PEZI|nr:uncharacterized protein QBC33DRAFT_30754 [Phialemonium atrogriseum]KAK1772824.1 hypothetical protein QBC33DRAFT_30754 [Phialemonium atrogriseum]